MVGIQTQCRQSFHTEAAEKSIEFNIYSCISYKADNIDFYNLFPLWSPRPNYRTEHDTSLVPSIYQLDDKIEALALLVHSQVK